MSILLGIDPGHGGRFPGAYGVNSRIEKTENLKFALAIQAEALKKGLRVFMTRTTDRDFGTTLSEDLKNRANLINNAKCDVAISCHLNSSSPPGTGSEALVHTTYSKADYALASGLAQTVSNTAGLILRRKPSGVLVQSTSILSIIKCPVTTLETCFINNSSDMAKYDNNFSRLAVAVVAEIMKQFGVDDGNGGQIVYTNKPNSPIFQNPTRTLKGENELELEVYPTTMAKVRNPKTGNTFYIDMNDLQKGVKK